jgi:hypothetical protein
MQKRVSIVGMLGIVALTASACGSSSSTREQFGDPANPPVVGDDGTSGTIGGKPAGENPRGDECQKMDIVFVVDDSGSMKEEQTNLAANFPKFVSVLEAFKTKSGSKIDYRLAVTTSGRDLAYTIAPAPGLPAFPFNEKGDNGAFRQTASCGGSKRWVDKGDPGGEATFACRAKTGTGGPSIEMPLYALKLALNDRVTDGTNGGFLRDDALLAVVVLTDEDDCSREDNNFTVPNDQCPAGAPNVRPVSEYAAMLDVAAKGPGRWAAAVIAGETSCKSAFGDAAQATRLKDFVSLAGKNGTFSSICAGDLSGALQKALDTFDAACKSFPPVR